MKYIATKQKIQLADYRCQIGTEDAKNPTSLWLTLNTDIIIHSTGNMVHTTSKLQSALKRYLYSIAPSWLNKNRTIIDFNTSDSSIYNNRVDVKVHLALECQLYTTKLMLWDDIVKEAELLILQITEYLENQKEFKVLGKKKINNV